MLLSDLLPNKLVSTSYPRSNHSDCTKSSLNKGTNELCLRNYPKLGKQRQHPKSYKLFPKLVAKEHREILVRLREPKSHLNIPSAV